MKPDEAERTRLVADLAGPAVRATRWTRATALGLFAGLLAIAVLAPISSGSVATGQLAPSQGRQIVQHPKGGVIAEILVEEGQHVEQGDLLVRLAGVEEGAAAGVAGVRVIALRAEEVVRSAEAAGLEEFAYPAALNARAAADPEARDVLSAQRAAFDARQAQRRVAIAQIDARRTQITERIGAAVAQGDSARTQLDLVRQEIKDIQPLVEEGFALRTRLLALERAAADLEGTGAALAAEARRLLAEDKELEARRRQLVLEARTQAAETLQSVKSELAQAGYQADAAEDALARIEVRAPAAGSVVNIRVQTIGGVVGPGEPILDISPTTDFLIVRVRLRPQDADDVRVGAEATVRFDMLNTPDIPRVKGRVSHVSPDALADARTGEAYFEAQVEIAAGEAKRLPPNAFAPGLPAEVLIHSGSRTMLSYLLAPIDRVSFRALRES